MSRFLILALLFLSLPTQLWAETSDVTVSVFYAECTDGIDNDGDGLVDYPDDTDCTDTGDNNESYVALTQCSDGLDNDGDNLTDYPDDPGCDNADDDDETNTISTPASDNSFAGGGNGQAKANSVKATPIQVTISGPATSSGDVVILENDVEKARIPSSGNSTFSKTFTDLTPGLHRFSVFVETSDGNRVLLNNYPVTVTADGNYSITGDSNSVPIQSNTVTNSSGVGRIASSDGMVVEKKVIDTQPLFVVSGFTEPFAKVSIFVRLKSGQLSQLANRFTANVFSIFGLARAQDQETIMLETTADENGYYEFVFEEEELDQGEYVAAVEIETTDGVEKRAVDFIVTPTDDLAVVDSQAEVVPTFVQTAILMFILAGILFWLFIMRKKHKVY